MIGVDILEIHRLKKIDILLFLEKFFTENERNYIAEKNNAYETIAGVFCAKEAVLKIFGFGISKQKLLEIEVLHLESGKPIIQLHGNMEKEAASKNYKHIEISISHTNQTAIAFAVAVAFS